MLKKVTSVIRSLGPGLLFAGAAIGVSHLVQSTRAGADYGFGLLWALLIVNIFKYPFIQFGTRYAIATGESLIEGYMKLGKGLLIFYFVLTFLTMFTIQAAVTVVTAGLASHLFGFSLSISEWSIIITVIILLLLLLGRYKFLDPLMKAIVLILTISSVIAVFIAGMNAEAAPDFSQVIPSGAVEVAFLIAFLGWMPAPLDVSIWQSLWTLEKQKGNKEYKRKRAFLDFNIGYVVTVFIGACFIALGNFVMHNSGTTFGTGASEFASQLIQLYTDNLGEQSAVFIAVAAFTTMFSTAITTLDASPRSMAHTTELLFGKAMPRSYLFWILLLAAGTMIILSFLLTSMIGMVKIATIISFLTAPFYALANYILINSSHTPAAFRPNFWMRVWSILGIVFLIGFSIWYLITLF